MAIEIVEALKFYPPSYWGFDNPLKPSKLNLYRMEDVLPNVYETWKTQQIYTNSIIFNGETKPIRHIRNWGIGNVNTSGAFWIQTELSDANKMLFSFNAGENTKISVISKLGSTSCPLDLYMAIGTNEDTHALNTDWTTFETYVIDVLQNYYKTHTPLYCGAGDGNYPKISVLIAERNDEPYLCLNMIDGNGWLNNIAFNMNDITDLSGGFEFLDYTFGDKSTEEGYTGGTFDNSSDTIDVANLPSLGVSNTGFINIYNPSSGALVDLGSEIFPNPIPNDISAWSVVESVVSVCESLVNQNLINYVIDCHLVPVAPSVGATESIKVGWKTLTPTAPKVNNDYVRVDCGTLNIGEYYNNFIDYVGTRAKLFLPFVGFVPIKNEFFQNGALSVKYNFNIIDGSFVAFVIASSSKSELNNSVIASYSGNCCVHIPLTGTNYSTAITSGLSGAIGTVASLQFGNVGGAISGALNTVQAKPDIQQSNGYNASSSYLGNRTPYLVIEREVSAFPTNYQKENGFPFNVYVRLGDITGFTICDNPILDNLTDVTSNERENIYQLLTSGIIIN